jgi:hypothetical protein
MDMGHSDPFALDVFAYSPTFPKLCHVYGFDRRSMHPGPIAQLLIGEQLDHDNYGGIIGAIGWPDGMVADTAGLGGMILDELEKVYGIKIKPADKKNKFDAIELFNGDLIDGKILILKGSRLEEQLQDLQWVTDDYGNLKEDRSARNDHADAAIYARREAQHLFQEAPKPGPPTMHEQLSAPTEQPEDLSGWFGSGSYDDSFWG